VLDSRESANPPQLVLEAGGEPEPEPEPETGQSVTVQIVPRSGVSGTQRVNFALPLARGALVDESRVRIFRGTTELAAARRALARHPDGSLRSVQLQVDLVISGATSLTVRVGEAPAAGTLSLQAVENTLTSSTGTPRVWALLPAAWLSASGVAGPQVSASAVSGAAAAWNQLCDYDEYDADAFVAAQSDKGAWLYDRVTTNYRGYVRRGDLVPLESAYREAHIYRSGITGTGTSTRIGVPGSAEDLKYHYTQGLAIHYLLTGDARFRDSAEDVGTRIAQLWTSPGYAGGSDFWTERHAGFALLGYVWAGIVTDDKATTFASHADTAVTAYAQLQDTYPPSWPDSQARCFAHTSASHGESYGNWGCSPWMSAILAEALDAYATERSGTSATRARTAIVKLGRILARDGRDSSGKPYYWLAIGAASEEDPYDEHWGEPAYAIALAWHHQGKTDSALRTAALSLLSGLAAHGTAPHIRSFNWQCRAAVATPYYLQ
jgi:hypothetical protein